MDNISPRVWILTHTTDLIELGTVLEQRGVEVTRISENFVDVALSLYDSAGLLVIDCRHADALATLTSGLALIPVLAIAEPSLELPSDILRIDASLETKAMAHHITEILAQGSDFRRYPRIFVDLAATANGQACRIKNASLYGVWLIPGDGISSGDDVDLSVTLSDGANLHLAGRAVAIRDGGIAVRTRPVKDADLVLWLHVILGALSSSPLHSEADPFGPLFR